MGRAAVRIQRVFHSGFGHVRALDLALLRARSIARIGDPAAPIGSGVLTRGSVFHPAFGDALVVVTPAHVARDLVLEGCGATPTSIDFREVGGVTTARHVLFISPDNELDAALIVLTDEPTGAVPCPVRCSRTGELVGSIVYLAGHPEGGDLQYSIGRVDDECEKFIYHRAATLPGSSGSGFFAMGSGDLVGIHQAVVDRSGNRWYRRSNWKNRGVRLTAIVEAANSFPESTILRALRRSVSTRSRSCVPVPPRANANPGLYPVPERALLPGDVVLTRGKGPAADSICSFTGSIHSHATMWLNHGLVEAALPDVHPLNPRALAQKARFGHVFRHRSAHSMLGLPAVADIVESSFMTREYSVTGLLVATAISTMTLWTKPRSAVVAQWIAEGSGQLLERIRPWWEERTQGSVTCCELIVRAFAECRIPIRVAVDVRGELDFGLLWKAYCQLQDLQATRRGVILERTRSTSKTSPFTSKDVQWLVQAQRAIAHDLSRAPILESNAGLGRKVIVTPGMGGDEAWSPALVTPRQLRSSQDLYLLGRAPREWWT